MNCVLQDYRSWITLRPRFTMKTITTYFLLVLVVALANVRHSVGFTPSSLRVATTERAGAGIVKTSTTLQFGPFSAPKDDGSPGDYVCKVGRLVLDNH